MKKIIPITILILFLSACNNTVQKNEKTIVNNNINKKEKIEIWDSSNSWWGNWIPVKEKITR